MINIRYHIISVTAIFLALGIGLTLGSTFLDRATVDNLKGQLNSLEDGLGDRERQITSLEAQLSSAERTSSLLDEQGAALLSGQLEGRPVVIVASRGADDAKVNSAIDSLAAAGAEVDGIWWLTERFELADDADAADLAAAIDSPSEDPARLRRLVVEQLATALRERQAAAPAVDPATTTTVPADPAETTTTVAPETPLPDIASKLITLGYIEYSAVGGAAESAVFPAGTSIVMVGGSTDLADDVVLVPLLTRIAAGAAAPLPIVVTSAAVDGDGVSDAVTVVRDDDALRTIVSTVDGLSHFSDWAAMVLALDDLTDGVVGHYGLDDGASRLLPAPSAA